MAATERPITQLTNVSNSSKSSINRQEVYPLPPSGCVIGLTAGRICRQSAQRIGSESIKLCRRVRPSTKKTDRRKKWKGERQSRRLFQNRASPAGVKIDTEKKRWYVCPDQGQRRSVESAEIKPETTTSLLETSAGDSDVCKQYIARREARLHTP